MKPATKKQTVNNQTNKKPKLNKTISELNSALNSVADVFGNSKLSIALLTEYVGLKKVESKETSLNTLSNILAVRHLESIRQQNDQIIRILECIYGQHQKILNWQQTSYSVNKENEDHLREISRYTKNIDNAIYCIDNRSKNTITHKASRSLRKLRFW